MLLRKRVVIAAVLAVSGCSPQILDLDPVRPAPQVAASHIATADGLALPYRSWRSEGSAKAVVVALHGFNDYSNFFDAPARHLAADGIISYAYDQRGFGQGPFRTRWFATDRYIEDARAFTQAIAARHPDLPFYLLGMSMGGAVTLSLLGEEETPWIDGAVLVAPAIWGRQTMPAYQTAALWIAAHTVPRLHLTGRGIKVTPSDNIEMLRALGRDPIVIKGARTDAIYGLVNLMDRALEAASTFDDRALIVYGARDEIIQSEPTRAMMARLPTVPDGQRRIGVYDGGYHMLLRDTAADIVLDDIAHWILNPDAALPSGAEEKAAAFFNAKK